MTIAAQTYTSVLGLNGLLLTPCNGIGLGSTCKLPPSFISETSVPILSARLVNLSRFSSPTLNCVHAYSPSICSAPGISLAMSGLTDNSSSCTYVNGGLTAIKRYPSVWPTLTSVSNSVIRKLQLFVSIITYYTLVSNMVQHMLRSRNLINQC